MLHVTKNLCVKFFGTREHVLHISKYNLGRPKHTAKHTYLHVILFPDLLEISGRH